MRFDDDQVSRKLDLAWRVWVDVTVGFCLACVLLAFAPGAQAQEYGSARIVGDRLIVDKAVLGSTDTVETVAGETRVARNINAPRPGGGAMSLRGHVAVPPAAAFKIAAKALSVASGVGAILTIADLYNDYRCATTGSGIMCDPGVPATSGYVIDSWYRASNPLGSTQTWGSPQATCDAWASFANSANGVTAYSCFSVGQISGTANVPIQVRDSRNGATFSDTANPNFHAEEGACTSGNAGFDGRCAGGTPVPKTAEEAAALVPTAGPYAPQMSAGEYEALVREALGQLSPLDFTSGILSDTPLEFRTNVMDAFTPLSGSETITSNPDGSTVADHISWNFARINDTLGTQEQYAITETKTTTTTAPGGATSTTTSTKTGGDLTKPSPDATTSTGTGETDCDKYPESAGCRVLGDPPSDAPEIETRDVSWVQENLGLPAQCPAPLSWPIRNWTFTTSWQAACDVAPWIRAGVLALTLLGVAFFLVHTVNGSD
jgi:hypothetical protein